MRSLKSGLIAVVISGLFGTAAVVGCSANGGDAGIGTGELPTDPTADPPPVLPPSNNDDGDDGMDAGKKADAKDAAPKKEAGVDAGPPPPVEGTPCTTLSEIKNKTCGACGKAETVCLDDGSGNKTWSPYGTCDNELVGGCTPGTVTQVACGNCGTQTKTCTQYCAFSAGACTGQPVNSCVPGTTEYSTAGCSTAQTYRNRTCAPTCVFSGFTATCETPTTSNKMTASATVGGVVTATWTLAGDTRRPDDCPGPVSAASDHGPYAVVEVTNPSATKAAELSVYQSQSATGKANVDMVMWTYAGNALPMSDALLGACVNGVEDYCLGSSAALAGNVCGNTGSNFYFAGIEKVTIPAGGTVLIYSSTFSTSTVIADGTFNLNLKTTKLQ